MRGPTDRSMSRGSSKAPMDKAMRESTISFFNEVFGGSKKETNQSTYGGDDINSLIEKDLDMPVTGNSMSLLKRRRMSA